jgi:hypothetical protein
MFTDHAAVTKHSYFKSKAWLLSDVDTFVLWKMEKKIVSKNDRSKPPWPNFWMYVL